MKKMNLIPQCLGLLLLVSFLSGCASASPETRAGEWTASTDFGELTFVVDPSGTAITHVKYRVQPCSSGEVVSNDVTFVGEFEIDGGLPISSAGFYLTVEGVPQMRIQGSFNKSGTRATGTWNCNCLEEWVSKR